MHSKTTPGFLFVGRLVTEKGFDIVLGLIKHFLSSYPKDQQPQFFIFGEGGLEKDLIEILGEAKNVHYFGRRPHEEIMRYLENIHFKLMPSRFLETFGKTALEALSRGKPVIGFKKGGLEPFVFDQYDILKSKGNSDQQKLNYLGDKILNEFDINAREKESAICQKRAEEYTEEKWLHNFEQLGTLKNKKILLVSDYTTALGGIEVYLRQVKDLLESHGYDVEIFGRNVPKGRWNKLLRVLGLGATAWNFVYAQKLRKKISGFKPDVVRLHSVSRFLGRNVVQSLSSYDGKVWRMIHDLGYFHPYPTQVYETKQISSQFSLSHFLKAGSTWNPLKIFFMILKFLHLKLLKSTLKKNVDLYLIPSEFIRPMLEKQYGVKSKDVVCLPHFQ